MKKTEFIKGFAGLLAKSAFRLKKHSPEILIVAGVMGVITSTVLACKATAKIGDILDKTKEDTETIRDCAANESMDEYSKEDAQKDLGIVYAQTIVKLVKLYAPAATLGVLSIGGIVASNNILRTRNMALAAAYVTVDRGFKEYRSRVAERFGKETDRELKHNIKAREIEEVVIDENGSEKTVNRTVEVAESPDDYSGYARFFDDGCTGWEKNPEYNLMFLRAQEQYANDILKAKGHIYLNDVYDMLGIPKSKAGQVVGWVYDAKNPNGDNYVDFGIYNAYKESHRNFVNGYEPVILLDFNVDGNILDLMGKKNNYFSIHK